MKTNLLGMQEQRSQKDAMTHSYLASQLASMIYWDNQNKYVWGKDRQEDLLELFSESIDWEWTLQTSQSKYLEGVQGES